MRVANGVLTNALCRRWKDKRGNWHVLYHRMFDPSGPLNPNWGKEDGSWKNAGGPVPSPGWAGGHAWSRDGHSASYNTASTSMQKDAIDRGFLSIYVMCCWRRLVELDAVLQYQHPAHRRHHI